MRKKSSLCHVRPIVHIHNHPHGAFNEFGASLCMLDQTLNSIQACHVLIKKIQARRLGQINIYT